MNKIYLVGHPAGRFEDDFGPLSLAAEYCPVCNGRVDSYPTPLEFQWDREFQSPKARQLKNQRVFWGSFLMVVPDDIRKGLISLSAFDFYETCLVKTKFFRHKLTVERLGQTTPPLYWARPKYKVVAEVSGATPNPTCPACGLFTGHPRQLTRLRIASKDIPKSGVFYISQNGDPQILVTEEAKLRFKALGIDAGYYSAGRIE